MIKQIYSSLLLICLYTFSVAIDACAISETGSNTASKPEDFGFSSEGLNALEQFLSDAGSSSFLLLKDGQEVFSWGSVNKKHLIHSIRKPLISALYGKYIAGGLIDPRSTLKDNGIDDIAPSLSALEKSASIYDLLKSRSGVYHDAAANSSGMLTNRPQRNSKTPGEHYFYNNWDFNVLGAVLEQKTKASVFELLLKDIAKPIGMEHFQGEVSKIDGEDENAHIPNTDGFYQYEKSQSKYPAYHFRLSAQDLAKFGQLYLNEGKWGTEQILPKAWIKQSTQPYSVINENYGIAYGMLWFVLMKTDSREHQAFYHTGNGVHFLGVYPHSGVVIVHRVDTEKPYTFTQDNFYQMINMVWRAYTPL